MALWTFRAFNPVSPRPSSSNFLLLQWPDLNRPRPDLRYIQQDHTTHNNQRFGLSKLSSPAPTSSKSNLAYPATRALACQSPWRSNFARPCIDQNDFGLLMPWMGQTTQFFWSWLSNYAPCFAPTFAPVTARRVLVARRDAIGNSFLATGYFFGFCTPILFDYPTGTNFI